MASPAIDYSGLADQVRAGAHPAIDYSGLADQVRNGSSATIEEPKSKLARFAQSWWDHSVLKHPIDSAVGLVKSLVTFPDYHQLSQQEMDTVDAQMSKAFEAAAHPTPELAGQVASQGTNAAIVMGVGGVLARQLGAVVDAAPAIKAGVKAAAPDVATGTAKIGAGAAASELLPAGPLRYVAGAAPVYSGSRQIARGIGKGVSAFRTSLADKAGAAASAIADDAEQLDGIAQGMGYKSFKDAPADGQKIIKNLSDAVTASPNTKAAPPAAGSPPRPNTPVAVASPVQSSPIPSETIEQSLARYLAENKEPVPVPGTSPSQSGPIRPPLAQNVPRETVTPAIVEPFRAPVPAGISPAGPIQPPIAASAPGSSLPVAQQLRQELIKNGWNPPAEESTPINEGALTDMYRSLPQAARRPVADASFAGDQNPKLAEANYKAQSRMDAQENGAKLAQAIHEQGATHAEIEALSDDPEEFKAVMKPLADQLGIQITPHTIKATVNHKGLLDAMDRLKVEFAKKAEATQ